MKLKTIVISLLTIALTMLLVGIWMNHDKTPVKEEVKQTIIKKNELKHIVAQEDRIIFQLNQKTMKIYQVGVIEEGAEYSVPVETDALQIAETTYDSVVVGEDLVLIDHLDVSTDMKQSNE